MPEVGVKGLRPGCAKEYGAEDEEPTGELGQKLHRIPRVERFPYPVEITDVGASEDAEHKEPQEHERSEQASDFGRARALENLSFSIKST